MMENPQIEIESFLYSAIQGDQYSAPVLATIGVAQFDHLKNLQHNEVQLRKAIANLLQDEAVILGLKKVQNPDYVLDLYQRLENLYPEMTSHQKISRKPGPSEHILTHLSQLVIRQFHRIKDLQLNLSPHLNIILGKNAHGKTTILQALALAVLPDNTKNVNLFQAFLTNHQNEEATQTGKIEIRQANFFNKQVVINKNTVKVQDNSGSYKSLFLAYGTNIFTRYHRHNYQKRVHDLINGTNQWYYADSLFQDYSDDFMIHFTFLKN
ncbi:MAG: AAA family ATPase [Bacteroidia bacterium]|nr:AAA family ATPase [Bacteroidia bacterium]